MPTADEIQLEKERLYESESLRDEIDDAEATILLKWGEAQIDRIATQAGDFEQQCRFLRQLLKSINRYIGQRQFMDDPRHNEYMDKISQWLPQTGFVDVSVDALMTAIPTDATDMAGTLAAILNILTPPPANASSVSSPAALATTPPDTIATIPSVDSSLENTNQPVITTTITTSNENKAEEVLPNGEEEQF